MNNLLAVTPDISPADHATQTESERKTEDTEDEEHRQVCYITGLR